MKRILPALTLVATGTVCLAAAKVEKGSGTPNKDKVGTVSLDQVREIARTKMKDLNAYDEDAAVQMIQGTARSMGIEVK